MVSVVIIDNEIKSLKLISTILSDTFPGIKTLGKTQSPFEGMELINTLKPNLVLLDIEMQLATGFDILEAIPERKFETIFITANDRYAIKAFRYNTSGHILKPINIK